MNKKDDDTLIGYIFLYSIGALVAILSVICYQAFG